VKIRILGDHIMAANLLNKNIVWIRKYFNDWLSLNNREKVQDISSIKKIIITISVTPNVSKKIVV
jgi:hypothetical protein